MTNLEKYNCHKEKLSFSEAGVPFLIPIIITLNSDPDLQVLSLKFAELHHSFHPSWTSAWRKEVTAVHFVSSVVERENTPNATEFGKDANSAV